MTGIVGDRRDDRRAAGAFLRNTAAGNGPNSMSCFDCRRPGRLCQRQLGRRSDCHKGILSQNKALCGTPSLCPLQIRILPYGSFTDCDTMPQSLLLCDAKHLVGPIAETSCCTCSPVNSPIFCFRDMAHCIQEPLIGRVLSPPNPPLCHRIAPFSKIRVCMRPDYWHTS
jgi:hypothetical protein